MTYAQVFKYFWDKRDVSCSITEALTEGGYKQLSNTGYLKDASVEEIDNPSQWWHLMHYCLKKYELHIENEEYKYTPCGELVFWMAEVSGAVDAKELELLKDELIKPNVMDRIQGNKKIKEVCWKEILKLFK